MAELMASGDFRTGFFCGGLFFFCLLTSIFVIDIVAGFVSGSREAKRRQRLLDAQGQQSHIHHENQKHWSKYT